MKTALQLLIEMQTAQPRITHIEQTPLTAAPTVNPAPNATNAAETPDTAGTDLTECRILSGRLSAGLLELSAPVWKRAMQRGAALRIMASLLDRLAELCAGAEGFDDPGGDPFSDLAVTTYREWLKEVKAADRSTAGLTIDAFATSGRQLTISSATLDDADVIFAADNATVNNPRNLTVYRAAELRLLHGYGPDMLRLAHAAKQQFNAPLEGEIDPPNEVIK